jgi:hypothetical protein
MLQLPRLISQVTGTVLGVAGFCSWPLLVFVTCRYALRLSPAVASWCTAICLAVVFFGGLGLGDMIVSCRHAGLTTDEQRLSTIATVVFSFPYLPLACWGAARFIVTRRQQRAGANSI